MRRKIITTVVAVGIMLITSLASTACDQATYEDVINNVFDESGQVEQSGGISTDISDVLDEVEMDVEAGSAVIMLPGSNQMTTGNKQEAETTNTEQTTHIELSSSEESAVEDASTSYLPIIEDITEAGTTAGAATENAMKTEDKSDMQPSDQETTTVQHSIKMEVHVTGVRIDKTNVVLKEGESEYITITVEPYNATNKYVLLNSTNTHVATIDAYGKITAHGVGKATISAITIDGGYEADCEVAVVSAEVLPTSLSLNKTSVSLNKGDTTTLTATVNPSTVSNKSVTWSSSNTSVATVNSSGIVTAVGNGVATITVKTADEAKIASCKVTVMTPPTGVSLNKTSVSLNKGDTTTLTATVNPSTASNKSVTWSSSNTSVATVNNTGKITAVGNGVATITVKTTNGGKTASCTVTVTTPTIAVTGVNITNKKDVMLDCNSSSNKYYQCSISVSPSTASNKAVTWSSSDTSIATVDSNGKITAKTIGTATITVKTVDGSKTDNIKVYVYKSNAAIPKAGNTWYKISLGSTINRVLDVCDASTYNGSKVQLYTSNGSDAQLWQFHNYISSHGGIAIVPKCNSGAFILDVNRGSSYTTPFAENNLIDLWTLGQDNAASMWELVRTWDGGYIFRLVNTNWVAGVTSTSSGAQLMLRKFDLSDMNQRWFLEPVELSSNTASQGIEKAISWAKTQMNEGNTSYSYWCLKFIGDAFRAGGISNAGYATATQAGNKLITSTSTNPPRGAVVFWDWYGTIDGVYANYGHVGISLGNGQVIHADYNGIKITGLTLSGRTYRGWGTWK